MEDLLFLLHQEIIEVSTAALQAAEVVAVDMKEGHRLETMNREVTTLEVVEVAAMMEAAEATVTLEVAEIITIAEAAVTGKMVIMEAVGDRVVHPEGVAALPDLHPLQLDALGPRARGLYKRQIPDMLAKNAKKKGKTTYHVVRFYDFNKYVAPSKYFI